jgi:uncharacterized protein YjbI with pentapeptide repeats
MWGGTRRGLAWVGLFSRRRLAGSRPPFWMQAQCRDAKVILHNREALIRCGWAMAEQAPVDWPTCDHEGCIGIRLGLGSMCLAHAAAAERDEELDRIGDTGEIDLRGAPISSELLEQVIAAAPHDAGGQALIASADFGRATLYGDAVFDGATFEGWAAFQAATFGGDAAFRRAAFQGGAGFEGVTFQGSAVFDEATFQGDAGFDAATFKGWAGFEAVTFEGEAVFREATFHRDAMFDIATFHGDAMFNPATFQGNAGFDVATFQGHAGFNVATFQSDAGFNAATFQGRAVFLRATFHDTAFRRATFHEPATFTEATFLGDAGFADVEFRHRVRFDRARFERSRKFGPLLAHRGLVLDEVQFAQPVQVEVSTTGMCCRRARFPGGVQFRLRWARVVLDDTDFPAPSILAGIPRLASEDLAAREKRIAKAWQRLLTGAISEQPRLLSLQRANVTGLGLSNVDMANCRFAGAHNLDKLRLEADVNFATAPSRLGRLSQGGWRQVIAEERAWRASRSSPGWEPPLWPEWPGYQGSDPEPEVLNPGQIAGLYRALRKGREDIKDEPGAADFYYGEMEMRRRARRPGGSNTAGRSSGASWGLVERVVLTAYWLVSGYGLRAWRALVWLAGITAALAVAFHLVGFVRPPQPDTYWTSLLYAFRATLSLTDPEVTLTAWGKFLQAVLRLTGPVLLGLAILALRGRVKR